MNRFMTVFGASKMCLALLCTVALSWAADRALLADPFTRQKELLPPPRKMTDDPPLPELTGADKSYLMKLARRALEHSISTGQVYQPPSIPASLKDKDHIAYVSCRQAGRMIESIGGEGASLAENVCRAAQFVAGSKEFGPDKEAKLAGLRESTIELNVLAPGQRLNWATLEQVANAISPGVHGLATRVDDRTLALKDSVAPTHNYTSELLIKALLDKAGWFVPQVVRFRDKVAFYRFRSVHLLEWKNAEGFVELFRCAQLVRTEQINRQRLDMLIDLVGRHMLYRQLKSGLFSYNYSPAEGKYLPGDVACRQAGATWAMARLARVTGEVAYELAALKAIDTPGLRFLDEARKAACASYPSEAGAEGLGSTALVVCALVDVPNNGRLGGLRDKLAAGLLHQQRPDGSFKVYHHDREDDGNRFYYPGECLLALMKLHRQTGDRKYLDAVEKAFDYYKNMFDTEPAQSFCPWQIQAWALAFDATGKRQYADFVFQMGDYLVTFQADEAADVYPDMVGGFVSDEGVGGVGSAVYLEGLVEACRIARTAGDAKRAETYARSLLLGTRFLDQLIFKEPEAYYCVTRKDVIGGVKMSPIDHVIRIDNSQHAALALLGVREALFPLPSTAPPAPR